MIPLQFALRRRMMMAGGGGAPISDLPLGTLINIGMDGGAGTPTYEIADKDNLVSGGVVLVRKNIYSNSAFGSTDNYPNGTLDNLIKTIIYNNMPQKLRDKMMDVTFKLRLVSGLEDITRKMFALTRTMVGLGNNGGVAEGKALQLYTSDASRVKTFNGSASNWRLSSLHNADGGVWVVLTNGSATNYSSSSSYGVVPAFVIPSKTPYDPTPNTDGSYNLFQNMFISSLPLGTLIRIADSDGGAGTPNYEIADKDNLVSGGVVLVRKNVYSESQFGSTTAYTNGTLDNLIKTTIYNEMSKKLQDKMMDVTFNLYGSGDITRKMFALTYTMAGFGNNEGVAEGKALQLYTSDASRVKTFNGSEARWWLSSQDAYDNALYVKTDGSANFNQPSNTYGVVPAFVIPSETLYDAAPNTDGSYNLFQNTPISDLPPIGTPLSDWTWEQIVALSNSGRDPQNYFSVGDEKDLILTTGEVVPVVIGDFYHNTITGTSTKAPIAFTFKNCLNTKYAMNGSRTNSGGWDGSVMRNTQMPAILNTFPAELIADGAIKYVDVLASAGGKSTSLVTSSDRLRLHSIVELGLNSANDVSGEGTKYAYYTSGNQVKTINGEASIYWTRSPSTYLGSYFCDVSTSGSPSHFFANAPYGVACGFDI